MPGAVIIGVGPGIGLSVARRFARGGMPVSVIARTGGAVDAAVGTLRREGAQVTGLLADSTDEDALSSALERAESRYGVPDVLVYNAALVRRDRLGELSAVQLLGTWAVNVGGAATAAAHTGRKMAAAGHGTLIITGGMPEPLPESFSLSLGKAGVRTLVELLDQELGPSGVHVTTVTVYGAVAAGTAFDPDEIAETYWQLSRQPRKEWTREVAYTGPAAIPRSAAGEPSASGRLSATASGAVGKPAWPRPPWLQHDRQKCTGRAAGIACASSEAAPASGRRHFHLQQHGADPTPSEVSCRVDELRGCPSARARARAVSPCPA